MNNYNAEKQKTFPECLLLVLPVLSCLSLMVFIIISWNYFYPDNKYIFIWLLLPILFLITVFSRRLKKNSDKVRKYIKNEELISVNHSEFESRIINSIPIGMHIYDLEDSGRLVFRGANPAADLILGVDNSIFIGKTIEEAFPALTATEVPQRYREAAAKGVSWHTEQISYEENLIKGAFEVQAFQIGPSRMAAAFTDITDRKVSDKERSHLIAILETTSDLVSTSTLDAKITYMNMAGYRMLGWDPNEDLSKFRIQDVHPEWAFRIVKEEGIPAAIKYGLWQGETALVNRNGVEIPVSQVIIGHRLSGGEVDYLSTIMRDITERKIAEKKIKENEILYSTLVESLPDSVTLMDMEGRVKFMSSGTKRLYGLETIEGVTSDTLKNLVAPESMETINDLGKQLLDIGEAYAKEIYLSDTKGRSWIGESWLKIIVDASGNKKEVLAVTRDITDRKRMEEENRNLEQQVMQSQKMDAIGTLAGGIAHDFNNILAGIFGYTELSLYAMNDPAKLKKYLNEILSSAERAREMVNQILTFSRHTESELKEVTPKYIIKEALKFLRASIPSTIEIHSEIKSDSSILGDLTQLHQIVVNLCTNAAYAMKDSKGTIELILEDMHLDEEFVRIHPGLNPGEHILFTISDTGCGIKPEYLSRIFEPFFTTKPQGEGTGLGLSVVHGIVKRFKGSISVYSEPGKGTVFNILIPVVKTEKTELDRKVKIGIPRGSENILLLDDEPAILQSLQIILTDLGYKVITFSDSLEAIDAFIKDPASYDIVITDYTMPHFTGAEIAAKIKEIRSDIPVILCSGFIHEGIEKESHKTGVTTLLRKPVRTDELAMTIRKVLTKE